MGISNGITSSMRLEEGGGGIGLHALGGGSGSSRSSHWRILESYRAESVIS